MILPRFEELAGAFRPLTLSTGALCLFADIVRNGGVLALRQVDDDTMPFISELVQARCIVFSTDRWVLISTYSSQAAKDFFLEIVGLGGTMDVQDLETRQVPGLSELLKYDIVTYDERMESYVLTDYGRASDILDQMMGITPNLDLTLLKAAIDELCLDLSERAFALLAIIYESGSIPDLATRPEDQSTIVTELEANDLVILTSDYRWVLAADLAAIVSDFEESA